MDKQAGSLPRASGSQFSQEAVHGRMNLCDSSAWERVLRDGCVQVKASLAHRPVPGLGALGSETGGKWPLIYPRNP